jgi:cold-inducible RNA-binding protein
VDDVISFFFCGFFWETPPSGNSGVKGVEIQARLRYHNFVLWALQSIHGRDDLFVVLPFLSPFPLERKFFHAVVSAHGGSGFSHVFSGGPQMGKKLYVGNLSYGVTDSDLETMFAAHGTVQSAQVIMDRETSRSKGFGFVEMGNDQEAQAAIAGLNGKDKEGRALTVNEARPREERSGAGARGGSGGGRRY